MLTSLKVAIKFVAKVECSYYFENISNSLYSYSNKTDSLKENYGLL